MKKKVVVAFSGGLDTSFTVMYLAKEKGYEVYAACANTGGFSEEQLKQNEENAYKLGATKYVTIDVTKEYYEKSLKYMVFGNVLRNGTYPISVSSERIFQALAIARYANEIGADAIWISNHGGRQLDGSRAPFDQLREIVDAVGGEIEIILDGGVRRGTHILKSLASGATAASGGRLYLYALAAAGQPGVERAILILKEEIERGMRLMGVTSINQLTADRLRWR